MDGDQEKKQFNYPKREEVIEQIKALDDDIQHVSLNLIKCNFDATEKDIEKAFPEFKFIKVKNYNPGSFEVVFETKIDGINFIRNCYDRKILNRRFFIKMGRQHKEVIEDWACVGYVPRKFNQHKKGEHHNKEHRDNHHKKRDQQHKPQEKKVQGAETKVEQKTQNKQVKKQAVQNKPQSEPVQPVKKQNEVKKQVVNSEPKPQQKKPQTVQPKKQEPKVENKAVQAKKQVKKQQKKPEPLKSEPVQEKQVKAAEQTKGEEDEWIQVPAKSGKNKKR